MSTAELVPPEIFVGITLRLPPAQIFQLKYVCKKFFDNISYIKWARYVWEIRFQRKGFNSLYSSKIFVNYVCISIHPDHEHYVKNIIIKPKKIKGTKYLHMIKGILYILTQDNIYVKTKMNKGYVFELWNPQDMKDEIQYKISKQNGIISDSKERIEEAEWEIYQQEKILSLMENL